MIADRQTHTDKHTGTIITILHSLISGGVTNVYSNESVHSGVRALQSCDVNAPIALKVFKTRVHFLDQFNSCDVIVAKVCLPLKLAFRIMIFHRQTPAVF